MDLGANFPQYFAAIAPMGAGFVPEELDIFNLKKSNLEAIEELEVLPYTLPVFYVGGELSPLPVVSSQPTPNSVDAALAFFFKMNKVDES